MKLFAALHLCCGDARLLSNIHRLLNWYCSWL